MILYIKYLKRSDVMSTYNLMNAVRAGKFEKEFKECKNSEDKISLFKKYGISISKEEYEKIENTVAAIKRGESSAYDVFEEKQYTEEKINNISDYGLSMVYGSLMSIPYTPLGKTEQGSDNDMKIWKDGGFLTGKGLF